MPAAKENWAQMIRTAGDHREFVGPSNEYDLNAAMQFNLLTFLGLREFHTLLDIGCGSLRGGRLLIVYLLPGHYFGIEPEQWLVGSAISKEIGRDLIKLKSPTFSHNGDFACDVFNQSFDYILAQGVFTHAPEWQIRKCVSGAAKCMSSASILVATYVQGDENYSGREWLYPKTTSYTPTHMAEMASSSGLACVPISWPHPRGAKWILLCNPENEYNALELADQVHELRLGEKLVELQMKLTEAERRLARLRTHPYVKIGIRISRLLRRLSRFN